MGQEQVVEALRQFVLRPDEQIEKVTDTAIQTNRRQFDVTWPGWLVRRESWVRDAVVVQHDAQAHGTVYRYGFLWTMNEALFLNSVETMRALGRRLDAWADALAFAQILAELHYSVHEDGEAVVYPFWEAHLVLDPREFLSAYPAIHPSLVAPPRVNRGPSGVDMEFRSYYRYLLDYTTTGVDVLAWTVTASSGQPAAWNRHLVAEGVPES